MSDTLIWDTSGASIWNAVSSVPRKEQLFERSAEEKWHLRDTRAEKSSKIPKAESIDFPSELMDGRSKRMVGGRDFREAAVLSLEQ